MSLRINKDNIYRIPSKLSFFDKSEDDSMDGDFTLFARIKITNQEVLEGIDKFVISRNGAHSGISIVKDDYNYNMYASEKYVRQEVRELRSQINESASDIGADIKYLFSLMQGLQEQLDQIKERLDNES